MFQVGRAASGLTWAKMVAISQSDLWTRDTVLLTGTAEVENTGNFTNMAIAAFGILAGLPCPMMERRKEI